MSKERHIYMRCDKKYRRICANNESVYLNPLRIKIRFADTVMVTY